MNDPFFPDADIDPLAPSASRDALGRLPKALVVPWQRWYWPFSNTGYGNPADDQPVAVRRGDGSTVVGLNGELLAPTGVSVMDNVRQGEKIRSLLALPLGRGLRDGWVVSQFARERPMDYQRSRGGNGDFDKRYVDFGNYNFGAVAAAAGYSKLETMLAAGLYNATGGGETTARFLNDPTNLRHIEMGHDDYIAGRLGSLPPVK